MCSFARLVAGEVIMGEAGSAARDKARQEKRHAHTHTHTHTHTQTHTHTHTESTHTHTHTHTHCDYTQHLYRSPHTSGTTATFVDFEHVSNMRCGTTHTQPTNT